MEFEAFFERCQKESTVSDFESYLSYCVFEKGGKNRKTFTLEAYSVMRDRAFEERDEEAARSLYKAAEAAEWKEGEWDGAMK
jgi:hypothetical protein